MGLVASDNTNNDEDGFSVLALTLFREHDIRRLEPAGVVWKAVVVCHGTIRNNDVVTVCNNEAFMMQDKM